MILLSPCPDHPRIRGEHPRAPVTIVHGAGSSPHTRGARGRRARGQPTSRIIPAYAGSTPRSKSPGGFFQDHPRIRGEHDVYDMVTARGRGSSPHTRGARRRPEQPVLERGIIPAYAGSTFATRRPRMSMPDHPRIRGEHGGCQAILVDSDGSSPHTRGARQTRRVGGDDVGIIPAYAGSTFDALVDGVDQMDHPRIRGEHVAEMFKFPLHPGSSPHTRGAPVSVERAVIKSADHPRIRGEHPPSPVVSSNSGRIIPAYAGSTL